MKKSLFIIGLCVVLLSMPTILAFPTTNKISELFPSLKMSDGTFMGGFGRGHWGNGKFIIDNAYGYMNGVYTSGGFLMISGELTKDSGKIGEINAFIINNKIIFGHNTNNNGKRTLIFGIIKSNEGNQFICRILISSLSAPYMWILLIPNT